MLLGSLTKELKLHGILNPRATKPFDGHNVRTMRDMVKSIRALEWFDRGGEMSRHYNHRAKHSCSIGAQIQPTIEKIQQESHGLKLGSYQRPLNRDRALCLPQR